MITRAIDFIKVSPATGGHPRCHNVNVDFDEALEFLSHMACSMRASRS